MSYKDFTIDGHHVSFGDSNSTGVITVDGDLWLLANARYDDTTQEFYRVDRTRASFALEMQATHNIPGEAQLGFTVSGSQFWVAQPAAYDLIRGGGVPSGARYAAVGGWELGYTLTSERNMTLGGMGLEIDGNGTLPYGRVVHNTTGTIYSRRNTGIARNLYADFGGKDDDTKGSWFMGYTEPFDGSGNATATKLVFAYVAPGSTTWQEFISADQFGNVTLSGQVYIPTKTPASATAPGFAGQIAWDANYIYICVATNQWKRSPITAW